MDSWYTSHWLQLLHALCTFCMCQPHPSSQANFRLQNIHRGQTTLYPLNMSPDHNTMCEYISAIFLAWACCLHSSGSTVVTTAKHYPQMLLSSCSVHHVRQACAIHSTCSICVCCSYFDTHESRTACWLWVHSHILLHMSHPLDCAI